MEFQSFNDEHIAEVTKQRDAWREMDEDSKPKSVNPDAKQEL